MAEDPTLERKYAVKKGTIPVTRLQVHRRVVHHAIEHISCRGKQDNSLSTGLPPSGAAPRCPA